MVRLLAQSREYFDSNGLNGATKHVATHRPDSLEWAPVMDLGTDIVAGICSLKSTDGPDLIVWGSSSLMSVLLEQGLENKASFLSVKADGLFTA